MLRYFCFSLRGSLKFRELYCYISRKFFSNSVDMEYTFRNFGSNSVDMELLSGNEEIIWVDLEMTGLDVDTCKILEIACIISDSELNIINQLDSIVIHETDEILSQMNAWCKNQHGKSGLLQASRNSRISLQEAEMRVLSFVRQHTVPGKCLLGGNSVHVDKTFIDKYMPQFSKHLHYRIIDVSTVKELCRRWYPYQFHNAPRKLGQHRALDDIRASIEELKYYKNTIFKK